MDARAKTVSEILYSGDQYLIPFFQRPYSWRRKQWERLRDDVWALVEDKGGSQHFLGPLVCTPGVTIPGEPPAYQLIDGQQRLTTLTLILAATRDLAREHGQDKLAAEIEENYLVHRYREGLQRYKIVPRLDDREVLIDIIEGKFAKEHHGGRVVRAYQFFQKAIGDWALKDPQSRLAEIFKVVCGRLSLVVITIDKENPYEIFESLNSTGLPLEESDLIRNYMFMQVSTTEQMAFHKTHWEPFETMFAESGHLPGIPLTGFYRSYLMRHGDYSKARATFVGFKKENRKRKLKPVDQTAELKRFAACELMLRRPQTCESDGLRRMLETIEDLEITTAYPLLMVLLDRHRRGELDEPELLDCLKDLSGFVLRRSICGESTRAYGRWFPEAIKSLRENPRDDLRAYWLRRGWPDDRSFVARLQDFALYRREPKKCRLILEALERSYGHKEKVDPRTLSVEHVMPQTIKSGKSAAAWKAMLGERWATVHDTWLHTLGNLTLSGYNQNLGNKPYDVKRAELIKSNLVLNDHFASVEVWDEVAIQGRGSTLAEEVKGLWPCPEGGPSYVPPSLSTKERLAPEERRKRRREYWDGFLCVVRDRSVLKKLPKAATSGWLFFPMGTTLFRLITFADPGKRSVGVALICRGKEGRANYETFRNERTTIEAELGEHLLWQEKPHGKTFHISLRRAGSDSRDRTAWPPQYQWLAEKVEAFHAVFSKRCQALIPEGKKKLSPEDRRKRREQYWSGLVEVFRERGSFETLPRASTSGWMNFPLGTSLFRLIAFARPSKKYVGMTLVCRGKKGRENFEALRKEQSAIETEIGDQLVWEEMPNGKVFHLTLRRPDSDTRDTTAWPQQHEWLADKAERFHSVFAERCQSMTPEEAKPKLRHKLRKKFWTGLLERAAAKTSLHADITPGAYHWAGTGAGMGGLGYNYVITKKGSTVELYIDRGKGQKTKNKQIFDTFKESQAEIDAVFGESLEWERLDSKRACRIVYRFENTGYRSPEEMWPEIQNEMIDAMVRLEKALSPHIAALKESV